MHDTQFGTVHGLIAIDSHLKWARVLKKLKLECNAPVSWWRMPNNPNLKVIRIKGDYQYIGHSIMWTTFYCGDYTIIVSNGIWFQIGQKAVWVKDEPIFLAG